MFGLAKRVIDPACPDEECIGEPVEIPQRIRRNAFAFLEERDDEALGATADRARDVKLRARRRTAGSR